MAKSKVRELLDKVIGDEGIKSDIAITLTDASAVKLGAVLLWSGLLVSLGFHLIRTRMRSKQLTAMQDSLKAIELALTHK